MASYIITSEDLQILNQSEIEVYSKLDLLNWNGTIIDSLEGNLTNDSFNKKATSGVRTSYSATLQVTDESFVFNTQRKVWMNKKVVAYSGYKNIRTNNIKWYKIGTFVYNDIATTFNETNNELSVSCSDLMCILNGTLGGTVPQESLTILAGENARSAVVALLADAGVSKYIITDMDFNIPYDMEYGTGVTYYTILYDICSLYSGRELFFDKDGIFVMQLIPTCKDEDVYIDDDVLIPLVISENYAVDYTTVANHIILYGNTLDIDRYSTACTYSAPTYSATFDDLTSLTDLEVYAISIPNINPANALLNINGLGAKNIVIIDTTNITAGYISEAGDYSFMYRADTDDFLFLGGYQIKAEIYVTNVDSPFHYDNLGYYILKVLSSGDYDKIYTTELAKQRIKYELWQSTNLQDTIVLNMVSIPWLAVNKLIEYTSLETGETDFYIIKSITGSTTDNDMSVTMIRYYEEYSDII